MKPTQFTWLGHATWQIETRSSKVLLDPFLDENPAAQVRAADVAADYILISHGHFDHIADAVSIAKRCNAIVIANYEIATWLGKQGVARTIGMNLGGQMSLPFGIVKMTPAWHSSTLPDGSGGGTAGGFVVEFGDGKAYFACDTALFSDMKLIGEMDIDLFVCPIGDLFTMGPEDALKAVKFVTPKKVAPSHYNTWPPIAQDPKTWASAVYASTGAKVIVRAVGESFGFGDE